MSGVPATARRSALVSPVAIVPVGALSTATLLWRYRDRVHVTVVAKATFALAQRQPMTLLSPEGIDPARDMLPYRAQTDVVVIAAHACASRPVEAAVVGLAVHGSTVLMDKPLLVYAPRPGGVVSPFTQAAIVKREGRPEALVVNPRDPTQRGSFGPRELSVSGVGYGPTGMMLVEDHFDWESLHLVPPDQRVPYLRGDEWIVLKGMFPDLPRFKSRLPGATIETRIYASSMWAGKSRCVATQLDQVAIDVDLRFCSLLWRGGFTVADENTAREATIVCALQLPGVPIVWPSVAQVATSAALQAHRFRLSAYANTERQPGDEKQRELEASMAGRIQQLGPMALKPIIGTVELETRAGDDTLPPTTENPYEVRDIEGVVVMRPLGSKHSDNEPPPSKSESGTLDMTPDPNELASPASGSLQLLAIPGAPWSVPDPSRRAAGGTVIDQEPADLPEPSVDALEQTLSDSLHDMAGPAPDLDGVLDRFKR